jgi:predicted nuclease of predicted toxin-antitoxin system
MARLYTNENFRRRIVETLRALGHDVLTAFEAGNANLSIPDDEVLDFARSTNRIVLTFNRKDFIRLHNQHHPHSGIIVCKEDKDNVALAHRIHEALSSFSDNADNQLIRVNRPNLP